MMPMEQGTPKGAIQLIPQEFFQSAKPLLIYSFLGAAAAAALLVAASPLLLPVASLGAAALLVLTLPFASWLIRLHSHSIRCTITQSELVFTSGMLQKTTRTIPLSNIDNISVSRTFFQHLLSIGTLNIDTPGGYGYEAVLSDFGNNDISKIISLISSRHKPQLRKEA